MLTPEEVLLLLEGGVGPEGQDRARVAYGAGLRLIGGRGNLQDVVRHRQRNGCCLRIEQGKGQKDRNGMLSPRLLELLREWWLIGQPTARGCSPGAIR